MQSTLTRFAFKLVEFLWLLKIIVDILIKMQFHMRTLKGLPRILL